MGKSYEMQIAGLTRKLPLCRVADDVYIAAFVIFGDVEMTQNAASALLKIAPPHDIMITAESKGIPLIHEMARQEGVNHYIVARKTPKVYMKNVISFEVTSITTKGKQTLFVDSSDIEQMKGKRVLLIDDVVSTGESLRAVEMLVEKAGGTVAGKMAILAEGSAKNRKDIQYLRYLPLFHEDGTPRD